MSVHRRPSALRSSTARFAIAGAASLATLMAAAPMAVAEDDLAPDSAESTQTEAPAADEPAAEAPAEDPAAETPVADEPAADEPVDEPAAEEAAEEPAEQPAADEAAAEAAPTDEAAAPADEADAEAAEIVPNYGERKIRIGVQLADGSYVTDGTTVAGSTFTISVKALDGSVTTATCTATQDVFFDDATLCPQYYAPAGATVTVTQATAPAGITPSNEVKTFEPCDQDDPQTEEIEDVEEIANCQDDGPFGADAIFTVTGLLPDTTPDAATVKSGESVTIDVLSNDDSDDPRTSLTIDTPPAHGSVVVSGQAAPQPDPEPDPEIEFRMGPAAVAGAGTLQVVYTADEGFSGTDTFRYAVTNSNGTATGTVTVDVQGAAVDPPVDGNEPDDGTGEGGTGEGDDADPIVDRDDEGTDDAAGSTTTTTPAAAANLPDAGGVDSKLLGYAALLLAAGGAATVAGRRRPERHARVG